MEGMGSSCSSPPPPASSSPFPHIHSSSLPQLPPFPPQLPWLLPYPFSSSSSSSSSLLNPNALPSSHLPSFPRPPPLSMPPFHVHDTASLSPLPPLPPPLSPSPHPAAPARRGHRRAHSDFPARSFSALKEELELEADHDDLFSVCVDIGRPHRVGSSGRGASPGGTDKKESGGRGWLRRADGPDDGSGGSENDEKAGAADASVGSEEEGRWKADGEKRSVEERLFMDSLSLASNGGGEDGRTAGQCKSGPAGDADLRAELGGHGDFDAAELSKIAANEKLAEIALLDPKRAKRILANRQSAARSKERKTRYISELERRVQSLQVEATHLSTQLALLQRGSAGLSNENSELKLRLQAMEGQAKLGDALGDALQEEVRRLKLVTGEPCAPARAMHSNNRQLFRLPRPGAPAVFGWQNNSMEWPAGGPEPGGPLNGCFPGIANALHNAVQQA